MLTSLLSKRKTQVEKGLIMGIVIVHQQNRYEPAS